jgi:triacylglycerol lipase
MSAINMRPFTEQAAFFARCSEAAYLDKKEGKAKFKELGFDATFIDHDGSQAYWLVNDDDLVIVCRGTQPTEFKDIAADLKAIPVPSKTGSGKVHAGFRESVDDIWPELHELANDYGKTRTIWCTGHSLGAAMATLIAFRLQRSEDTPNPHALFTYGSPRVGNKAYIRAIEATGLLHFRFVNNADIVARVPLWPFYHFGGMYYINHYGNLRALTFKQSCKDVWRGFIVGLKRKEGINFFVNHSITRYAERLEHWAKGVEYPQ